MDGLPCRRSVHYAIRIEGEAALTTNAYHLLIGADGRGDGVAAKRCNDDEASPARVSFPHPPVLMAGTTNTSIQDMGDGVLRAPAILIHFPGLAEMLLVVRGTTGGNDALHQIAFSVNRTSDMIGIMSRPLLVARVGTRVIVALSARAHNERSRHMIIADTATGELRQGIVHDMPDGDLHYQDPYPDTTRPPLLTIGGDTMALVPADEHNAIFRMVVPDDPAATTPTS